MFVGRHQEHPSIVWPVSYLFAILAVKQRLSRAKILIAPIYPFLVV